MIRHDSATTCGFSCPHRMTPRWTAINEGNYPRSSGGWGQERKFFSRLASKDGFVTKQQHHLGVTAKTDHGDVNENSDTNLGCVTHGAPTLWLCLLVRLLLVAYVVQTITDFAGRVQAKPTVALHLLHQVRNQGSDGFSLPLRQHLNQAPSKPNPLFYSEILAYIHI
jgi:hypothetical protein